MKTHLTDADAWVLGLLQTDGHFIEGRPRIQLRLHPDDIDVLEKVKIAVDDVANAIKVVPNNYGRTQIVEFKFTNKFFYTFSYLKTEAPPEFSPTQKRAFLRGLFEGDGSLYMDKRNSQCVIEFTNNNYEMVKYVADELSNLLGLPHKEVKVDRKERFNKILLPSYRIYWTGRRANLIAWFLWHGDIDNTSMDRKRRYYQANVLSNNISEFELNNLLNAVKCEISNNQIVINIRSDMTLEWAQRIQKITSSNMAPVIIRKANANRYGSYYGLHIPKQLRFDSNDVSFQTIWN